MRTHERGSLHSLRAQVVYWLTAGSLQRICGRTMMHSRRPAGKIRSRPAACLVAAMVACLSDCLLVPVWHKIAVGIQRVLELAAEKTYYTCTREHTVSIIHERSSDYLKSACVLELLVWLGARRRREAPLMSLIALSSTEIR